MNRHLVMGSARELGTVALVAGLGGAYAASLIMTSDILSTVGDQAGGAIGMFLGVVSTVFIGIALYVAAVVITGCVATVISGRLEQIALLRLLGATSQGLRRSVRAATTWVGAVGATAGVVLGTAAADLTRVILVHRGTMPEGDYAWTSPYLVVAVLAVTGCASIAGWIGSNRVLQVTPAAAMSGVAVGQVSTRRSSRFRAAGSIALITVGTSLLLLGMALGESGSGAGLLTAFVGSITSGTGLLLGATFVIPAVVAACARLVGGDEASLIARRNAVTDPARTTRSTLGLVVGVGLVTTFAAGTSALRASLATWDLAPDQRVLADHVMSVTATVMICVVLISSVIAAIGFVSTMSLTVIQRRREIGLLRALGFTGKQVRAMITKESIALSTAAVTFGIALGLVYGSAGAQALIGAQTNGFVWGMPWPALAAIAACSTLLVLASSRPPARRALRITPVEALHIDT